MRLVVFVASAVLMTAAGCAHHKANQYAYAPPLAPAVYPQPQIAAQPVAYPAGAAGTPVVVPAAPGAAVPTMPVVTAAGDPCCPPLEGAVTGVPVVYESADQTPPCPPGP